MKKAVYTCVTEGFALHPVINSKMGWDFICFAEADVKSDGWEVRRIDSKDLIVESDFVPNDKTKTARRIKILPHLFLKEYDLSIWIDGSLQFRQEVELDRIETDFIKSAKPMMLRKHPYRNCIYREA
jgi:hypothetical protein